MPQQYQNDSWLQLLRLPAFDSRESLTIQRVPWQDVAATFGIALPYYISKRILFPKAGTKKRWALRDRALGVPEFAASVLSDNFAVAQAEYPESFLDALGMEDPPSPFELGSYLLACSGAFRVLSTTLGTRGAGEGTRELVLGRTCLMWWLAGISSEALSAVVPEWEEEAAKVLKALRGVPSFALWLIGEDLTPLITNRRKARALLSTDFYLSPERKEMFEHPYVQTTLTLGKRKRPVARWVPERPILWPSVESKHIWAEEEKGMPVRIAAFRKAAQDILKDEFYIEPPRRLANG